MGYFPSLLRRLFGLLAAPPAPSLTVPPPLHFRRPKEVCGIPECADGSLWLYVALPAAGALALVAAVLAAVYLRRRHGRKRGGGKKHQAAGGISSGNLLNASSANNSTIASAASEGGGGRNSIDLRHCHF